MRATELAIFKRLFFTCPIKALITTKAIHSHRHLADRIIACRQKTSGTQYRVLLYGSMPSDDPFPTSEHIPSHRVAKYWKSQRACLNSHVRYLGHARQEKTNTRKIRQ